VRAPTTTGFRRTCCARCAWTPPAAASSSVRTATFSARRWEMAAPAWPRCESTRAGRGPRPRAPSAAARCPKSWGGASRRSRPSRRCPRCAGTAPRAARAGRCWGMRPSARGRRRGARPAPTGAAGRGSRATARRTRRRACGVGQHRVTQPKRVEPLRLPEHGRMSG